MEFCTKFPWKDIYLCFFFLRPEPVVKFFFLLYCEVFLIRGTGSIGSGPRVSIEEDPSEAKSDVGMVLELEGVVLVDAEGMDTLATGGSLSPLPVPPDCGY
ncbi:hypothetical protein M9H77_12427 [Catharanthus roseus]|uniref:Uncharacterized protein n=1 Tax=Catharanthus roseus TaxID=4058 RepID=A0ACC0BHI4_CATRO|nr:hypothetical protein M9H77_12427 [Catharanthus roseus]